jgi:hypothetical protein
MDHETVELIQKATRERWVCRAYFVGEDEPRIIHPYGIFRNSKDAFQIACWQENGTTPKENLPGFRNCPLNKCLVNRQFNPSAKIYFEWLYHV